MTDFAALHVRFLSMFAPEREGPRYFKQEILSGLLC